MPELNRDQFKRYRVGGPYNDEVPVQQFGLQHGDVPPYVHDWGSIAPERYPVSQVTHTFQRSLDNDTLKGYLRRRKPDRATGDPDSTVRLYEHGDGRTTVYDGNHRVVRALIKGEPDILARVSRGPSPRVGER